MGLFTLPGQRRLAAYQAELAKAHYAEVENMYKEMRGWRHDYSNHLQTMKGYVAQGDLEAVSRYLDELDTELARISPMLKTGNSMADAILGSKISLARAQGIQVVADANIPVALTTPELELCTILGNLFDNAIEASLALPPEERMIRVYMDMKGTRLYICFTNLTAVGKLKKWAGAMPPPRAAAAAWGKSGLTISSRGTAAGWTATARTAPLPPRFCCRSKMPDGLFTIHPS